MAIYHLSVKTVSRSDGRSATAAAAYRAACSIVDQRTGEIHDYSKKGGVKSIELVLPAGAPEWASNRSALWNAVEQAETRKNSTVAREFEIALPNELSPAERQRLARDLAQEIVNRHGCVADVAIHSPGKDGDNRNHHAHILLSTRRLGPDGFTVKTRELDDQKTGRQIVTQWRERFASLQNERLREKGITVRVDHRSLAEQGIDREPTKHIGPSATGYERRTGLISREREQHERESSERKAITKELDELERQTLDLVRLLSETRAEEGAAKNEQESARRVADLARVKRTSAGSDYVFARIALDALSAVGGDSSRVDWQRVEIGAIIESLYEHQQPAEEVYAAIIAVSPLRADPSAHAASRGHVEAAVLMVADERQRVAEREKAEAAEREKLAAEARVVAARRVADLERLKLNAKGADHIFALTALRALMFADDNSERVDWRAVERSTVAEAVGEYGITREEALQAITDRSPLRADPASHAEIREYVSREAPGLETQYRRDQGLDHEDPPNDNDNDFSP